MSFFVEVGRWRRVRLGTSSDATGAILAAGIAGSSFFCVAEALKKSGSREFK